MVSITATSLDPLEKRIYQSLKLKRPLWKGAFVFIGVSGGLDSMVLLKILHKLQDRLNFRIHVLHFNHGIRGKDSDKDAIFVEKYCQKLGLRFSSEKAKSLSKKSSEDELREKRYAFFQKKVTGILFLAHHKDDQLETQFMRMLQGTGPEGLKAMAPHSSRNDFQILRPLLDVWRDELKIYAAKQKLKWREDRSNSDTVYLRNWIRKHIMTPLKKKDPSFLENMSRSLEILLSENEESGGSSRERVINRESLLLKPLVQQKVMLHGFLKRNNAQRFGESHIEEFIKRLHSPRKVFTFRLAGLDIRVHDDLIEVQ